MLLYCPTNLIQTIRSNDLDLLKRAINEDTQTIINSIDDNKLLHMAVSDSHTNMVKYLLKKGVNPNVLDYQGNSIVHTAIMAGHTKLAYNILKLFNTINIYNISLNFNLNIKNSESNALIHLAAKKGYISIIKLLHGYHADLNILDVHGNSAINIAAQSGHENTVQYLLTNGANPNIPDRYGNTPLYYAILKGYKSMESILIDGSCNISRPITQNKSVLFKAIIDNDISEIISILDKDNGDINITEVHNNTPLHFACYYNNHFIAKVLLIYGANPNAQQIGGRAPLHCIAQLGNIEFAKILIEYGAMIDVYNKDKVMPLELAVEHGHINMVKLLLRCGAAMNQGRIQDILQLKVTQCQDMEKQWKHTLNKNDIFNVNFKKYIGTLYDLKQLFEIMPDCQNEEYDKLCGIYNIYFSNDKPIFSLKILALVTINMAFDADDILSHSTVQDVLTQCNISLLGELDSDMESCQISV